MTGVFAAFALFVCATAAPAGEVADTYISAYGRYLAGEYEKAASEYEYIVTLGVPDPAPTANLALMYRDMGDPQTAAANWYKSTLLKADDPFLWNARAWNYLSLSRHREARDAFKKSISCSTGSVFAAEAYFGLGLTDSIDGNLKAAADSLQEAIALGNPYLHAAVDAELGRVKVRARDYAKAAPFLTSSLSRDQRQPEVARLLGQVYEKTNQAKAAWQAFKFTLDMLPGDPYAQKHKEKLERYIPGNPEDTLPLVRLARPMMRQPEADAVEDRKSPSIRVQMFSGPDGSPRHLTKFYVMGSSRTLLVDINLNEEVQTATDFTQWEILYRADSRVIEIRDTAGQIIYVTKQSFRLEAVIPGHTVLIKSPKLTDIRGMDIGDREVRGSVEVVPTPFGFHLINELPLDQYLFSVIGQALPRDELREQKLGPKEAYKALALLMRSKILSQMRGVKPNPERTHTCDSSYCMPYRGLTRERKRTIEAVRETRGMTVVLPAGKDFEHHLSCGGVSADGVQDRPPPPRMIKHPYDLELLLHDYPDPAQYSEQSADVPQIWSRWVRVLDKDELRENIERLRPVGPIRRVKVLQRDKTGRVQSLEVSGTRGTMSLKGADEIRGFLSPGSLRSTLFALQPLYHGDMLERLVVWGSGTGHGRGLCMAGTLGQASMGRSFVHILRHYFPGISFQGVPPALLKEPPPAPKSEAKKPSPRRMPRVKDRTRTGSSGRKTLDSGSTHRPPRKRRRPSPPSQ